MSKNSLKLITLNKGEVFRTSKKALTINCIKGVLWITFKGSKDIILEQGKNMTLKNEKFILLQALESSSIELL